MIAQILQFLDPTLQIGPTEDDEVTVVEVNGDTTILWRSAKPQPTPQVIDDAGSDLTVINGQTFSQWLLDHGSDSLATRKRMAREYLENSPDAFVDLMLAFADVIKDELNILRGHHGLAPRTLAQFKTAMKNKLN